MTLSSAQLQKALAERVLARRRLLHFTGVGHYGFHIFQPVGVHVGDHRVGTSVGTAPRSAGVSRGWRCGSRRSGRRGVGRCISAGRTTRAQHGGEGEHTEGERARQRHEHSVEDASPPGQEERPAVLACSLVVG